MILLTTHFQSTLELHTINEDNVLDEWYDLKQASSDLTFAEMCRHAATHNSRFKILSKLLDIIQCVPLSTSCERGFSAMNNIKYTYRSSLTLVNTDNLMNICINGTSVTNFDPMPSIQHWFSTERRPRF